MTTPAATARLDRCPRCGNVGTYALRVVAHRGAIPIVTIGPFLRCDHCGWRPPADEPGMEVGPRL